jgi:hypothetical protein
MRTPCPLYLDYLFTRTHIGSVLFPRLSLVKVVPRWVDFRTSG